MFEVGGLFPQRSDESAKPATKLLRFFSMSDVERARSIAPADTINSGSSADIGVGSQADQSIDAASLRFTVVTANALVTPGTIVNQE